MAKIYMPVETNNKFGGYIWYVLVSKFILPVIHLYCILHKSPWKQNKPWVMLHISKQLQQSGILNFIEYVLNKEDKGKREVGELIESNSWKFFWEQHFFVFEICLDDIFSPIVLFSLDMLQLLYAVIIPSRLL